MRTKTQRLKFDTSAGGSRLATSVGGSLLGIGGDIILIDDPHNTEQAESDAERKTALNWWKELSTTRLNDPKRSPLIVVMQRLHEEDVRRFKVNLLLIENKGPGISAAQDLQNRFGIKPWGVHLVKVKGDKVARALAAQPTFSQRLVYAPERDWSQMVIDEMATFPKGRFDDLVDSTACASTGFARTDAEIVVEKADGVMHRPRRFY